MARRTYTQGARLQTAEDTRRRIVEATFALHGEQGIAATTMKQIAARAGVSVGAVYHHFPTYDDAIGACGQLVMEKSPPPDGSIFEGLPTWPERLARLVATLFAGYERLPALEVARADRRTSPKLDEFLALEERLRQGLAAEALAPLEPDRKTVAALAALLDIGVWRALVAVGFSTAGAAQQVTEMMCAWIETKR